MGFFDNFGKSVSATGRTTIQKTKELADISKLNNQITENNNRIMRLYAEIGEQYCQLHPQDPEPSFTKLVDAVLQMKRENETWNDQIQDLRGLTKCPNCGKVIPKNMVFCSGCGQRVMPENVTVCPGCGAVVNKGILFCSQCGTRIPEEVQPTKEPTPVHKCAHCGALLEDGTAFCPICGTKVEEPAPAPVETPVQPEPVVEEPPVSVPVETPPTVQEPMEVPVPVVCPNCGEPLEAGQAFCANCGTPIHSNSQTVETVNKCPNCGSEIPEGVAFCMNCGHKV